ncbi:MAG: ComF family protein [Acidobacteriaceae bacterium]
MLRSPLNVALDSLSSVLFPADCRVCGAPLSGFTRLPVCSSCWNDLPAQSNALCARCGEALASDPELTGETLCRPCRVQPPDFAKAIAHGAYRGTLRTLLHLLKYDGMEPMAARLGALLAHQLLAVPDLPPDLLVVPVPLFRKKQRQRGFNQAGLLARGAIASLRRRRPDMAVRPAPELLERRRATESQAGLTPHQRRVNLRGAFFVPRPAAVEGKNILLIDDIYTTGATARACSAALRRAGAASVWVATVARAQKEFAMQPAISRSAESATAEIPMEEDFVYWEDSRTAPAGGAAR